MSSGAPLHYLVFGAPGFRGNPVTLYPVDALDDDEALFREAGTSVTEDNVYYRVLGTDCCEVRFISGRHELQLCGHGLLALANHLAGTQTTFSMDAVASGGRQWQMCVWDNAVWIRVPRVPRVAGSHHGGAVRELLNVLAVDHDSLHAFDNSAWVATVPSLDALTGFRAEALQACHHDYAMLGALILTTRLADDGYALRYFAPWYGKVEDSATGSAQGCLAPLWLRDGQCCQVRQYSPRGVAGMQVRLLGDGVWLTGAVTGPVTPQHPGLGVARQRISASTAAAGPGP